MSPARVVSGWPAALDGEFATAADAGTADAVRLAGVDAGVDAGAEVLVAEETDDPGVELGEAVRESMVDLVAARAEGEPEPASERPGVARCSESARQLATERALAEIAGAFGGDDLRAAQVARAAAGDLDMALAGAAMRDAFPAFERAFIAQATAPSGRNRAALHRAAREVEAIAVLVRDATRERRRSVGRRGRA
jgi:hypothetical protein